MSLHVAIIGASGFIGSRAVEIFHLSGRAQVRPIVRSIAGLAKLSRFDLDCRLADACDQSALRSAVEGCDAVVHAVAGDAKTILGSLAPVYRAAEEAGVRRLVYLSSASVHGQAPLPGSDESTPLSNRQPIPYNNARVDAEHRLQRLRENGSVELVCLRPAIVTGPRSFWITSFASDLLAGRAYLVNGGRGICNSIYVDNLVHAIHLSMTATGADGKVFLVGDEETVTWADLYRPIAQALGFDLKQVPEVDFVQQPVLWKDRIRAFRAAPAVRSAVAIIPRKWRQAIGAGLSILRMQPPLSPWAIPRDIAKRSPSPPQATLEMALLQQCRYKLPDTRARQVLGYRPVVDFAEACRRTVGWLAFAGYPVAPDHIQLLADSARWNPKSDG